MPVKWPVEFHDEFQPEFFALPLDVRRTILALSRLLGEFGPQLGRPRVDTLNGSRHANMKELRFSAADGEWRLAFAFDPRAQCRPARCGRQVGRQGQALLPDPGAEGRRTLRPPSHPDRWTGTTMTRSSIRPVRLATEGES